MSCLDARNPRFNPTRRNAPPTWRGPTHYQARVERDRKNLARVDAILSGMSFENVSTAREFLATKRSANSTSNVLQYAETLSALDRFSNATPWLQFRPDQVSAWLDAKSRQMSAATVHQQSMYVRHFLRWLHDSDDLPPGFRRATKYGKPSKFSSRRPIPPDHFTLLLEHFEEDLQMQAALHVLFEVGFRLEELLSLNVGSVEPDDAFGMTLRLPEEAQARFRLKTGPRACYATSCVGAVRAWTTEHPFSTDTAAPLFLGRENQRAGAAWLPLGPTRFYLDLKGACRQLELAPYTPHWFRHSAATAKARLGWNSPEANAYFGWTPGSKIWERVYVHLANQDMRDRVRRDAGVDNLGRLDEHVRACPACAEPIKATAQKCKHCGEYLRPVPASLTRRSAAPTPAP